ncbi:hypothetical protein DL96DRAFT_1621805 [Flagelloscypha sp. PMI_526]|nr:hypothetical protein DL96DRAFT_1621805 [Flagelloscypha sp. PMI_526]
MILMILNPTVRARTNRGHSKMGCLTCKIRRVKCDEIRPICSACSRRQEVCVWKEDPNALSILPHPARAALRLSKDHRLTLPPLEHPDIKELELLHTWTTHTIFTFIPGMKATRHGFQVLLPQLAFKNEFLLHATFAITSLHMTHLRPSSEYLPLAKIYCQRAVLGLFNSSNESDSSDAAIMSTILLATFWFAYPSCGTNFPDVFNWISASRLFMRRIGLYHQGFLDGTVTTHSFLPPGIFSDNITSTLAPFSDMFYQVFRPEDCSLEKDELAEPSVLAAYKHALHRVAHCTWLSFMHSKFPTMAMYPFLSTVPDEFIEFFMERRPRALILVAHYCAILGQFEGVWWYSWERCRHDLARILSLLDEKWMPCMEYPLNLLVMKDQTGDNVFNSQGDSGSGTETSLETGSPPM